MNIFTSTKFTWWQLSMLKWAVFCIGIAVGRIGQNFLSATPFIY